MQSKDHYIIGYGSLLQTDSRSKNISIDSKVIPVRVKGFRREWNFQPDIRGFTCTFLGVVDDSSASMNGILIPVSSSELPALDQRENGYTRLSVSRSSIEPLHAKSMPEGNVMIYQTEVPKLPEPRYPILQSYIDICLQGCMEIDREFKTENQFTDEFLDSTSGWSGDWVNDRMFPRAPFRHVPQAVEIDRILHARFPEFFTQIKIE